MLVPALLLCVAPALALLRQEKTALAGYSHCLKGLKSLSDSLNISEKHGSQIILQANLGRKKASLQQILKNLYQSSCLLRKNKRP